MKPTAIRTIRTSPHPLTPDRRDHQDEEQRRRLDDGDGIGDRHAGQRHDITEHARGLETGAQQRSLAEAAVNAAPLAQRKHQSRAACDGEDSAQEQHLERRQLLRDQLHEAVADHEGSGGKQHRRDAAGVGTSQCSWKLASGFPRGSGCDLPQSRDGSRAAPPMEVLPLAASPLSGCGRVWRFWRYGPTLMDNTPRVAKGASSVHRSSTGRQMEENP